MLEFTNVAFANKGDRLMLLAAIEALNSRLGPVGFVTRAHEPTASELQQLGMQRLNYQHSARLLQRTGRLRARLQAIPSVGRLAAKLSGGVAFADVSALLHVSGYAHGDPWGRQPIANDIALLRDAKRHGKPVIFLPKTYGPFSETRAIARELLELPDLIYVRDRESRQHLLELGLDDSRLHLAPDYTGRVRGVQDQAYRHLDGRACIIPSFRVVDKTGDDKQRYLHFLKNVGSMLSETGLEPFLLLHETASDPQIGAGNDLSALLPIVHEADPQKLKGIIGRSRIVISSRLHGAINGLSQAVPTIAVGWSHKYRQVMQDYGVADYSLDWSDDVRQTVIRAVERIVNDDHEADRISAVLRSAQQNINARNDAMWDRIVARLTVRDADAGR